ncbi:MAG: LLM class flavin-dependent oxidoreductase, partial [Rhizobiaceae bacterium]|nr:LLM class flavin-dependent oxidoreductase [Rhizobiaceae bacterium]
MKFHIAINLERMNDQTDIRQVRDHTLDMVQLADKAGFEIAWAAEHHALEMTIAPNPFQIMTWWAQSSFQAHDAQRPRRSRTRLCRPIAPCRAYGPELAECR